MLKIGAVVWGVRDIPRAVRFWSEALHYKLREPASEDWAVILPIEGEGMQLSLSQVASPHARRHHIDLFADELKELIGHTPLQVVMGAILGIVVGTVGSLIAWG